jgi:hypothetical protein
MPYEVPDVTVRQVFETQTPGLNAPALSLVLIGICNQIEKKAIAGTYSRGTQTVVSYPSLIQGAEVNTDTVKVFLQNDYGLFDITSDLGSGITASDITIPANIDLERSLTPVDSTTGDSNGIIFSDLQTDFLNLGVTTDGNSKIVVKSPSGNIGTYVIDEIIDANTVRIHEEADGNLDAAPDSVTPKIGVFTGPYTGSIVVQTDIGVNAHVLPTANLKSDYATGTTILSETGIGLGVKSGDFLRITHTTVAPEVTARAVTLIDKDNGFGAGEIDLTLAVPVAVTVADKMILSGATDPLNNGTYVIAERDVVPTVWNNLAIASLNDDDGFTFGEIVLVSPVPAGMVAGDLVTIAGATNPLNDGTYTIQATPIGNTIKVTVVLAADQVGAGGTASVSDISRLKIVGTFNGADQVAPGGLVDIKNDVTGGFGDASAAGDYRIVGVINDNSIEIASPGLLGLVDGTDIVAENVDATEVTANYLGTGRGRIKLPNYTVPVTITSGDKLILTGDTAGVTNDGVYEIFSITVVVLDTFIEVVGTFPTSIVDTTGTVDLQNVQSVKVDTFKIDRVFTAEDTFAKTAGDFVRVLSGAAVGNYEIIGVYPDKLVLKTALLGATINGDTFNVLRGIPLNSENNIYSILKVESGSYAATILVTYIARRHDLTEIMTKVISITDVVTQLGLVVPENPLAFAASIALQNTNNIIYALGINEDSVIDHQTAIAFLESEEQYCLVPLTQDDANIELYPAHVTIMSAEKEKRERICFLNRNLFIQRQVLPLNDQTNYSTDGATDPTGLVFTDAVNGIFQTASVALGDDLEILDVGGNVTATFRILSVNSETQITLLAAYTPSLSNLKYRIKSHALTKLEQAVYIRDYALSIKNRRAFLIWPDQVDVTYSNVFNGDGENVTQMVPGYYLCAALGGMLVEQDPQQPFTNVPINGIAELYHSNRYFRPSILDVMAEGGVYIVVQEIPEALPYTRHQLSTDMLTVESRELSIVKDVDYIAKYFRNNLRPYIGRFNVTKEYLNQVRTVAQAILRDLLRNGQVLPGTTIQRLIQDPDRPDSVILDLKINVPYPANYIRVTLYI